LQAGSAFLVGHCGDQAQKRGPAASFAFNRLLGNRLRELDRFLSILLDEIALWLDRPGHDPRAFARWHNVPRKLRHVAAMLGEVSADEARLGAIGRARACLHHCGGKIHDARLSGDLLLAQGTAINTAVPPASPDMLRLSPEALRAIAEFYRTLGDKMVAQALGRSTLDFSASFPHMEGANVACDGI